MSRSRLRPPSNTARNNNASELERFLPDLDELYNNRASTRLALVHAIPRKPRHVRLLLMSLRQIAALAGITPWHFDNIVDMLTARGLVPHEDNLSIPQRVAIRYRGIFNAPAVLLAEIHLQDPSKWSRHRTSILKALQAISAHKQIKLSEMTLGMLTALTIDDVYDSFDAIKHYDEDQVRTYTGCLMSALRMWELELAPTS